MAVIVSIHIATLVILACMAVLFLAAARAVGQDAERRAEQAEARAEAACQRAAMAEVRVGGVGADASAMAFSAFQRDLAPCAQLTDCVPFFDEDIDRPPQSGRRPVAPAVRARHVSMRTVVEAILAGDYARAGVSPPRTTSDDRAAIVAHLRRGGAEGAVEFAAVVGLDVRTVPAAFDAPICAGSGHALLQHGAADGEALLLSAVAFEALRQADLDAELSDVWALAAELRRPFSLFQG